jgi:hypothetical protein
MPSAMSFWKRGPPALFAIVVDAIGVREKSEAVGDRSQLDAKGIGGAANMPACRAGVDSRQHNAMLPGFAQNHVEAVHSPDGEQVGDGPATDPEDVLGEQMCAHIRQIRHGEELQVARGHSFADAGGVERCCLGSIIAAGGADETDSGAWLARDLEPRAHDGYKAQNAVLNGQAGAAGNNVFFMRKV